MEHFSFGDIVDIASSFKRKDYVFIVIAASIFLVGVTFLLPVGLGHIMWYELSKFKIRAYLNSCLKHNSITQVGFSLDEEKVFLHTINHERFGMCFSRRYSTHYHKGLIPLSRDAFKSLLVELDISEQDFFLMLNSLADTTTKIKTIQDANYEITWTKDLVDVKTNRLYFIFFSPWKQVFDWGEWVVKQWKAL